MPMAISVNMFGLRFTTEAQPRSKNGAPPQSTTGVASANCSQAPKCPAMLMARSGTESTTPTQNRRVIERSSGFSGSSALGIIGSRAMPQIGQLPASFRTICGMHRTGPERAGGRRRLLLLLG